MDFAALFDTIEILLSRLIRLDFAGLRRLMRVNSLFDEGKIIGNFTDMRGLFFHVDLPVETGAPMLATPQAIPDTFDHDGIAKSRDQWLAERSVCSMVVLKDGALIHERYLHGTRPDDRRISWSMSKSVLSATMGTLDLPDLEATIGNLLPDMRDTAYAEATLRNVLNMSSGVKFNEDYLDYHSDINRMGRILGVGGSMDAFAQDMLFQEWAPGTYCHYVSIDTHVLGMVMRKLTGERSDDLIRTRLLDHLGLEAQPYFLTDSLGEPFVLGGLNMTTRDYARFGQMIAQGGVMNGRQVVPEDWVQRSITPSAPPPDPDKADTPDGTLGYGYQWWTPPEAAEGEVIAVGIYGQNIYINQQAGLVVAINSADRQFKDGDGLALQQNIQVYRQIAQALT